MLPTPIQRSGFKTRRLTPEHERSTAWYIFNEENKYLYEIDRRFFMAQNGMFDLPIVTTGEPQDQERIKNEMIHTNATIIQMIDQFIAGARLVLSSSVAADIYKRISNHFDEHFSRMKTVKMYEAPDAEDFDQMAEFAVAIRPSALRFDKDIDTPVTRAPIMRGLPIRASFSGPAPVVEKEATSTTPAITRKLDNIQRYLELQDGR